MDIEPMFTEEELAEITWLRLDIMRGYIKFDKNGKDPKREVLLQWIKAGDWKQYFGAQWKKT